MGRFRVAAIIFLNMVVVINTTISVIMIIVTISVMIVIDISSQRWEDAQILRYGSDLI